MAANREALLLECPDGDRSVRKVSKMASERWKAQPESVKERYQAKFLKKKKKFDEEMAAFLAAGGEKQPGARAKAKARAAAKAEARAETPAPVTPAAYPFIVSIAGYSRKTFNKDDFKLRVPGGKIFDMLDENGRLKRSFSVKFKHQKDFNLAMELEGTDFGGRPLNVTATCTPLPPTPGFATDAAPGPTGPSTPKASAPATPRASAKRKREPMPVEQKSLSAFVQAALGKFQKDMKKKMDEGGSVDPAEVQKQFSDKLCKRVGIPPKARAQYSEKLGTEVWAVWQRLDEENYA